jgi:FtsP/CotA-like multicopper oxidase with cupredoxin domain
MQRTDGLYGLFIIRPKSIAAEKTLLGYDHELTPFIISDWYHRDVFNLQLGVTQALPIAFHWANNPQTLLINGKGIYNISDLPHTYGLFCQPAFCPERLVWNVVQGNRYRLRVLSSTSMVYQTFRIVGHKMTVVEVEGNYVEPVVVDYLNVNNAQSYSVIIHANKKIGNYWMTAWSRFREPVPPFPPYFDGTPAPPPSGAVLRYIGAPLTLPSAQPPAGVIATEDRNFSIAQERTILARAGTEKVGCEQLLLRLPPHPAPAGGVLRHL